MAGAMYIIYVYYSGACVSAYSGVGLSTRSSSLFERIRRVKPPFLSANAIGNETTQGAVDVPVGLAVGALDPFGDHGWQRRAENKKNMHPAGRLRKL